MLRETYVCNVQEHEENNNEGRRRHHGFSEGFPGAYDLTEHLVTTLEWLEDVLMANTYVEGLLIAAKGKENEQNRICIAGKVAFGVSERCMQVQICWTSLCGTVGDSHSMDLSVAIRLFPHCSETDPNDCQ